MLSKPTPTHPDFLAQLQTLFHRRDAKIKYEQKKVQYKSESLHTKSNVERLQYHSQYFQVVRSTREKYLEELGEQWYKLQRGRHEEHTQDYVIKFPTDRPTQVKNQKAYNSEVAVLSGIARHVGFPAAPAITGGAPAELDEDFEKLGVSGPFYRFASPHRHAIS